MGTGNGLFMAANRTLLHRSIPARLHGRAFGLVDACDAWGFGLAVIAGGALASSLGGRATFAIAGAGLLIVSATAARVLRRPQNTREEGRWVSSVVTHTATSSSTA